VAAQRQVLIWIRSIERAMICDAADKIYVLFASGRGCGADPREREKARNSVWGDNPGLKTSVMRPGLPGSFEVFAASNRQWSAADGTELASKAAFEQAGVGRRY